MILSGEFCLWTAQLIIPLEHSPQGSQIRGLNSAGALIILADVIISGPPPSLPGDSELRVLLYSVVHLPEKTHHFSCQPLPAARLHSSEE